jgi:hypothetical protein
MGIRYDLPKLPGKEPSYFNLDMGVGAAIGSFTVPVVGTLLGAAIGGYFGKERMQKELKTGRPVREPSMLNKGIAVGLLLGGVVATIAVGGGVLALASVGTTISGASWGLLAAGLIGTAIQLGGGYLGAKWRYDQMQEDVTLAENIARNPRLQMQLEKERAQGHAPEKTPEQTVQPHYSHRRVQNFADRVEASREAAAFNEASR